MAFEITQGDLEPAINIDLTVNNATEDISDHTGPVTMRWFKPDGTVVTVTTAIISAVAGQISYQWVTGDTDVPGVHRAQIVVPRPMGSQSFPTDGTWIRWIVRAKLSLTS